MAGKASDKVQYYQNPNGPTIGTVSRKVIEKDGLFEFRIKLFGRNGERIKIK